MSHKSQKIICLADDLTGLAEVAGQIANLGVRTTLIVEPQRLRGSDTLPEEKVVFINLGCRTYSEAEAKKLILEVLGSFRDVKALRVYLKVDSAARGPIAPLLEGIFDSLGPTMVPLLLANPSQGRSTRTGTVLIEGQPLHQSSFRGDPIHPRTSSFMPEILGRLSEQQAHVLSKPGDGPESGVCVLDAESDHDIERWADHYQECSAAAGAAPFGVRLLRTWIGGPFETQKELPRMNLESTLFVLGTRHPKATQLVNNLARSGCAVLCCDRESDTPCLPLAIHTPEGEGNACEILKSLVDSAIQLIHEYCPESIFVTGGETAQFLLRELQISALEPIAYSRHVALLAVPGSESKRSPTLVAMKPGSYYEDDLVEALFAMPSRDDRKRIGARLDFHHEERRPQ